MSNKNLANRFKENYSIWKNHCLKTENYFIVFNKFADEKLKNINGNSLKLYIYLGIHSDTYTGEVWHSIKTIAEYFEKSERTIRIWMKGLEDLNLIYRLQLDLNSESHTFLQPYIFRSDNRVEKYTYSFRINNLDIRDKLLLIFFEDKISNLTKKYFKNKVYLLVDEKEITITSYTPINNSIRNYAKFLNENLKEIIDLYIETNIETNNKDWSFESYKKKKKALDLIGSRKM
ncbi:helix-turn-helix domain-containing protein [Clostridium perfringens]|uniref:helix-turn-helix domain-containing protein n=1 Tax=Clostridium perfringens TaxID=1502 RepID=UPI001A31D748|nr:helix-turn-helix domain-containing protein [Clostridium perfringens]HAT4181356.1 helix-turn-helix domain-containing protein [Clostridium perfringens]HBI6911311.1 helix-turn-helix domain-containing protein [Clostridium perfringens]HBI6922981.1 helix-turn-helix domain-containing protein [Clostridium perfringens]